MAKVDVNKLIPDDIEKIDRNELMTFLDVTPTANASILVAIANKSIVFTSTLSFLFSTSSSVESFIIFPPIIASKIKAIQWSTLSTNPLNVVPKK